MVWKRKSMLRSMSPLLPISCLGLLVLSGAVLSVAAAAESKASENVVTAAEISSPVRATQGVFDLAQVAQDYELAHATAQKQGAAGEQLFWFHDQERQSALSQKIAARRVRDITFWLGITCQ